MKKFLKKGRGLRVKGKRLSWLFWLFFYILPFAFCLLPYSSLNAQSFQIPNSDFEIFEPGFNEVGQQPKYWYGSNVNQPPVKQPLVGYDTGRTGKCVYLHNEWAGAVGIGANANAYISLGKPWNDVPGSSPNRAIGGCEGGMPFTYRPDTLELWIKRTYISTEKARILVYLWKGESTGNSYKSKGGGCETSSKVRINEEADVRGKNTCGTTQSATLIGEGKWDKEEQYTDWTLIKVPITYKSNEIPEKINIMIAAANTTSDGDANTIKAGSKLWADDLNLIYSSKAHEIRVKRNDGIFLPIPNFDENTLVCDYKVKDGVSFDPAPDIKVCRSGRELLTLEFTKVNGVIDDPDRPTIITIRAVDDPANTTTYRINFTTELSNDPRPANILINGAPLKDSNGQFFNKYVTNYNITLPYGTTDCPEILIEKADEKQTYTITECTSLPGTAIVVVTAADGSGTTTYTLHFAVAPFSDNTLQNILINNEPLPNFNPLFNNYTVELLNGATAPSITYVSEHENLQTIIVDNSAFPAPTSIKVFSNELSSEIRTYTIRYDIVASSNAFLNDIKIGGVSLENFAPDRLNYDYILPRSTAVLPSITYEKGEQNQSVNVVENGVNGATLIYVKAENGNQIVYRINFSVFKSENSLLNNILINGISIPNFNFNTLYYEINLPTGTVTMPAITFVKGDVKQNVIINNGGLNGITTISVVAENTNFHTIYSLKISSVNSHLNAILVNGAVLSGFSPQILNYSYLLPAAATECPQIDVVKVSNNQQVFIEKPALAGLAVIRVISETAEVENVYTINFQLNVSGNNFLDSIKINGVLLAGFNNAITSYTVNLPQNTPAPAVEYFASDPTSKIFVIDNGLRGMEINVTAQSGATRTYSINYNIPTTNNTNLANIEIWDNSAQNFVSLNNFNAQTTDYQYSLAWRTDVVPAINPVAAESGQVITIFYNSVNDTTDIQVVAPNGINRKTYKIYFPVEKSSYAFLSSIKINGVEIANFNPQTSTYSVVLPYGITQTPQVAFEKGKIGNQTVFEQNIEITAGNLNQLYLLKVIAEDGTTQTYTLNFSIDMSGRDDENILRNIFLNGVPVANFNSGIFEYNVILPYGTTELPKITFTKNNLEQSIATDVSGVFGTAKIKVFSNIVGVATTEYRINFSVSDIPTTLNSIFFNSVWFNNFNPKINAYIVPVTWSLSEVEAALPTYSANYNQSKFLVNETFFNHKKLVLEVTNKSNLTDKNTYTFWFYYTNDVIPNPSFENWTNMAQASGIKPTFWNCQGDVRSTVGLFDLKNQVQRSDDHTDGNYSVFMQGQYNGSTTGDENGLITLGSVTSTGSTWGVHSTAVLGGIDFRNTPDLIKMDYKYTPSGTLNPSMYFVFRTWNNGNDFSAGEKVTEIIDSDGTTQNDWNTKSYNISYTGENLFPKRLNIILSSNNSENSYSYPTGRNGKLWVDNLVLGYNSKLSNISINGTNISDFSPDTYNYSVNISPESMGKPIISLNGQVPDQEHIITVSNENSNRQRTAAIVSKAEDGTTSTYTIAISRPAAAINTLAGISVDNIPIAAFSPNTFNYNVSVQSGSLYPPDILVEKGEGHQNISYLFANNKVTINVAAENGAQQSYTVNFVGQISDNAALQNIEVVGYNINFNSQTTEYQVVLPANTKNIPQISFTKQNDVQKVILTTSGANGTSIVRVIAQNGVNFTDYKIHFSTLPVVTSHLLSGIFDKNIPINNFATTTFNYTVLVDSTSKFVFQKEFAADTMNVVYFDDSIKCNTYTITFKNNNAFLAGIAVNGAPINTFLQNQFVYSINWNSDNLPYISVKPAAKGQTITYFWAENYIKIKVTAQDGITQNNYIVRFIPNNAQTNSLLEDILIDGVSLIGFVSNQFNYVVNLPDETTQIPVIQAIKGEQHQIINITTNGINNTTKISVTAQDGVTQSTYNIIFNSHLSDNAFLTEILINGVLIDGFSPNLLNYDYTFPYNTTSFVVDYTKAHTGQSVAVENNGISGVYKINVTSASGDFTNQYIINFDVEPSPNAYLNGIFVNGILIENFFPELLEYKLILPYGTQNVPSITYVKGDENQIVTQNIAATLSDETLITVTAANGNQNIYKISFEVTLSNNALLNDVIINGEPLRANAANFTADRDFNSQISDYKVTLPFGTTNFPVVDYIGQVADYHSVNIINNGFDNISVIKIISQNQRVINEYNIKFSVALSSNTSLNNILINNSPLQNFHSDTLHYKIEYPIGTQQSQIIDNIDEVSFVKGGEYQNVTVNIENDNTIVIVVTAQNGSWRVYVIEQVILKSSNALLADIKVDGKSIKDFDPNIFEYTYLLPYGTTTRPKFEGIKQEESQRVDTVPNNIGGDACLIMVTAEDGITVQIYSINFECVPTPPPPKPTLDNVCFTFTEGVAKFTTDCNNVSIYIYDILGHLVKESKIPPSDPNYNLCENENGITFHGKKNQIYIYMFIYDTKKRIDHASGKFVY